MIDLDRIDPDPEQPRKSVDSQHIIELAASISKFGVLQPISVRLDAKTDRYRIIAGECRFQACKQAGLSEIPCWVRAPEQNEILLQQIVENWQRSDLNAYELADSLGRLRDANGYSQVQLAEYTGKSKGEISKILSLQEVDPEVQQIVRQDPSGAVTRRHLYAMRNLPATRQLKLISGIQEGRYTAEAIELINQKHDKKKSETGRVHVWQHRTFKTRHAIVKFQIHKSEVSDQDLLDALREVKRQIVDDQHP